MCAALADLGSRAKSILPGRPTLLIDHHRPEGIPPGAELITGYDEEPTPTSGLLAYWCDQGVVAIDDLAWIAAISLLSDLGDHAPFAVLAGGETALEDYATARRHCATHPVALPAAMLDRAGPAAEG